MLQDFHDAARLWVRTEGEILVAERPPDGDDLIGFTGIDVKRMLEQRDRGPRRPILWDCNVFVIHGHSVLLPLLAIFPGPCGAVCRVPLPPVRFGTVCASANY